MTIHELEKDKKEVPFSSGTGAMMWYSNNCERCTRAWFAKDGNWPKESTMRDYVSSGKYCILQYFIDLGFAFSEVPTTVIDVIGRNEHGHIKDSCMLFTDDENDGYKAPKRPKPTPDNQMVLPFILEDYKVTKKEFA
jgi:hypothetical protein